MAECPQDGGVNDMEFLVLHYLQLYPLIKRTIIFLQPVFTFNFLTSKSIF